jgi:hypothetical protein
MEIQAAAWAWELSELLVRVGHRFGRLDLRRRMRAYVRELLVRWGRDRLRDHGVKA